MKVFGSMGMAMLVRCRRRPQTDAIYSSFSLVFSPKTRAYTHQNTPFHGTKTAKQWWKWENSALPCFGSLKQRGKEKISGETCGSQKHYSRWNKVHKIARNLGQSEQGRKGTWRRSTCLYGKNTIRHENKMNFFCFVAYTHFCYLLFFRFSTSGRRRQNTVAASVVELFLQNKMRSFFKTIMQP